MIARRGGSAATGDQNRDEVGDFLNNMDRGRKGARFQTVESLVEARSRLDRDQDRDPRGRDQERAGDVRAAWQVIPCEFTKWMLNLPLSALLLVYCSKVVISLAVGEWR